MASGLDVATHAGVVVVVAVRINNAVCGPLFGESFQVMDNGLAVGFVITAISGGVTCHE